MGVNNCLSRHLGPELAALYLLPHVCLMCFPVKCTGIQTSADGTRLAASKSMDPLAASSAALFLWLATPREVTVRPSTTRSDHAAWAEQRRTHFFLREGQAPPLHAICVRRCSRSE